jgi:restriction endonuclease
MNITPDTIEPLSPMLPSLSYSKKANTIGVASPLADDDLDKATAIRRHHTLAFSSPHLKTLSELWKEISSSGTYKRHKQHVELFDEDDKGEDEDDMATQAPVHLYQRLELPSDTHLVPKPPLSDGQQRQSSALDEDDDDVSSAQSDKKGIIQTASMGDALNEHQHRRSSSVEKKKDLLDEMGDLWRKQRTKSTRQLKKMAKKLNEVFTRKSKDPLSRVYYSSGRRESSTDNGEMWGVKV